MAPLVGLVVQVEVQEEVQVEAGFISPADDGLDAAEEGTPCNMIRSALRSGVEGTHRNRGTRGRQLVGRWCGHNRDATGRGGDGGTARQRGA
jgi:hypothetical protein